MFNSNMLVYRFHTVSCLLGDQFRLLLTNYERISNFKGRTIINKSDLK